MGRRRPGWTQTHCNVSPALMSMLLTDLMLPLAMLSTRPLALCARLLWSIMRCLRLAIFIRNRPCRGAHNPR